MKQACIRYGAPISTIDFSARHSHLDGAVPSGAHNFKAHFHRGFHASIT
jgi:hypothetical protein